MSAAGCASGQVANVPPGTAEADKFLYERGQAAVGDEKWADAREYFRNIVDNYPQSPFRPDAKLALGDTYLSQKGTENYLLAANEFREFQTFYPDAPARRLRAAPAGAVVRRPDAGAGARSVGDPRHGEGSGHLHPALSEQRADAAGARARA